MWGFIMWRIRFLQYICGGFVFSCKKLDVYVVTILKSDIAQDTVATLFWNKFLSSLSIGLEQSLLRVSRSRRPLEIADA